MGLKPNILVVDDDQSAIDLAQHYLLQHPDVGTVQGVSTGEMALSEVANGNIDLVLLDLALVDMSGIDVLKLLRKNASSNAPAVVVFTSCTSRDVIGDAVAAGADDYFYKGHLSVPGLLSITISAALAKGRLLRAAEQRATTPEAHTSPIAFGEQLQRCARRAARVDAACYLLVIDTTANGSKTRPSTDLVGVVTQGLYAICISHDVLVRLNEQRTALIAEFGSSYYRNSILLAKRILIALDEHLVKHGYALGEVEIAVGITAVNDAEDAPDASLARAERALAKAKGSEMRFAVEPLVVVGAS